MPLAWWINVRRVTLRIGVEEDGGADSNNAAELQRTSRGETNVLSNWHLNNLEDDFTLDVATG
jgi:hypothetical protein